MEAFLRISVKQQDGRCPLANSLFLSALLFLLPVANAGAEASAAAFALPETGGIQEPDSKVEKPVKTKPGDDKAKAGTANDKKGKEARKPTVKQPAAQDKAKNDSAKPSVPAKKPSPVQAKLAKDPPAKDPAGKQPVTTPVKKPTNPNNTGATKTPDEKAPSDSVQASDSTCTAAKSPSAQGAPDTNNQKPSIKEVCVSFKAYESDQFPGFFSLVVSKDSGDGEFASNPNRMTVDVEPPGATNIRIRQSNAKQMVVEFMAASKFEVEAVEVTVYDTSDLDTRLPIAVTVPTAAKEKTSDQTKSGDPKIDTADVILMQPREGLGQLKIVGSGFGDYGSPPLSAEDDLSCLKANTTASPQCEAMMRWSAGVNAKVRVILTPRNPVIGIDGTRVLYIDDKLIQVSFSFQRTLGYIEPFQLAQATVEITKQVAKKGNGTKATPVPPTPVIPTTPSTSLTPSAPASAEQAQTEPQIFSLTANVGATETLRSQFSILDDDSALGLFGEGVAKNFYVIRLSVVNTGTKKVSIPLASIQAEVEYFRGTSPKNPKTQEYLNDPPTLSPAPLSSVSAFFDFFNKTRGKTARIFNFLDGVTTLSSAILPFAGTSFKDAEAVFTAGFVPAVKKAVGDLSSQQLQNLTSSSWETTETVAAAGGSVVKHIFIEKNAEMLSARKGVGSSATAPDCNGPLSDPNTKCVKLVIQQISSIVGVAVTGFEVQESEAKTSNATQTPSADAATAAKAATTAQTKTPKQK